MLGGRDYNKILGKEINQISKNLMSKFDLNDNNKIHASEITTCTRLSYFERTDPIVDDLSNRILVILKRSFYEAMKSPTKEYRLDDFILVVTADLILEDQLIVNYNVVQNLPDTPDPRDLLYTNACLFGFDKNNGIVIYITPNGKHIEFFVPRSNRMFEQVVRRARILSILLKENKTPVVEPSDLCLLCKYNRRCFIQQTAESTSLEEIFGFEKK